MQQFIPISQKSRLVDIADVVGTRNLDYVLAANDLIRTPNIGTQFKLKCSEAIINHSQNVSWQKKSSILNNLTDSSDVFETAALLSEDGWKVLDSLNTFPNMLVIPETISLPDAVGILGNGTPIGRTIYDSAMTMLETNPHIIDPGIFNEYSTTRNNSIVDYSNNNRDSTLWQFFNIPWGDVTLYSSISDDSIDIPAYPEEMEDGRKANYTTMPDLLYNYEPWYLYQSSGPRSNTYTFDLHRHMWSGDHSDGKANELIRFCEANCYPRYSGASVITGTVTLYVKGRSVITGILESTSVHWDGPILDDGWYAHFTLELTITEISTQALNYDVVRSLPLIGG